MWLCYCRIRVRNDLFQLSSFNWPFFLFQLISRSTTIFSGMLFYNTMLRFIVSFSNGPSSVQSSDLFLSWNEFLLFVSFDSQHFCWRFVIGSIYCCYSSAWSLFCSTVTPSRRSSVAFAPLPLLPTSAGRQLRLPASSSQFSSGRTLALLRLSPSFPYVVSSAICRRTYPSGRCWISSCRGVTPFAWPCALHEQLSSRLHRFLVSCWASTAFSSGFPFSSCPFFISVSFFLARFTCPPSSSYWYHSLFWSLCLRLGMFVWFGNSFGRSLLTRNSVCGILHFGFGCPARGPCAEQFCPPSWPYCKWESFTTFIGVSVCSHFLWQAERLAFCLEHAYQWK